MRMLRYQTRNGSLPSGKASVSVIFHKNDTEKHLIPTVNDILDRVDCTVIYTDEYDEEFFEHLKESTLTVIIVTAKLLKEKNGVLDKCFPFAVENKIPVLPIIAEAGIESLFNEKCGELQFLDKTSCDVTAITYGDKLKRYLENVLLNDSIKAKIRDAFSAYVFLSYRKKDRRYANELRRLIHKNEFCRDIAIWYDEYLTPGENFNDSIMRALKKSDLFMLAVTPNLVNEKNYVMDEEYPAAVRENKPILAVELVPTDTALLKENYLNVPTPTSAYDEKALSLALSGFFEELKTKSRSDVNNFFIGLAYLEGIDVEVDRDRALFLIKGAAENGLFEAMEMLCKMYLTGNGVKRDLNEAVAWKRRLNNVILEKTDQPIALIERVKALNKHDDDIKERENRYSTREELEVRYARDRSAGSIIAGLTETLNEWYQAQLELSEILLNNKDKEGATAEILNALSVTERIKALLAPEVYPNIYPKGIISNDFMDTTYFDLNLKLIDIMISENGYSQAFERIASVVRWLDGFSDENVIMLKHLLETRRINILIKNGRLQEAYSSVILQENELEKFMKKRLENNNTQVDTVGGEIFIVKSKALELYVIKEHLYNVVRQEYMLHGSLAQKMQKYDDAFNAFFNAYSVKNDRDEPYILLGMVKALIGLKNLEEAKKYLDIVAGILKYGESTFENEKIQIEHDRLLKIIQK